MTRGVRRQSVAGMAVLVLAAACGGGGSDPAPSTQGPPALKIGFLLDNTHERWERDRQLFLEEAEPQGAEVIVTVADGDQQRQIDQAQELLDDGANVLVVVPHDLDGAAAIVERAKARGVPVVSYDRLIRNADVDLYVSVDSVKVGEMQAAALLERAPKGNYVLIGGSKTDHNALLFREGQMKALQPAIDSKAIRIVADDWATGWRAEEAARITADALAKTRGGIAAIVASNDVTAGAAIAELEKRGLAGKVAVSGQDAELAAVRRIVAGTQTMTVYKPLRVMTRLAANWAIRLAQGETVDAAEVTNNGRKDVPTMRVDPVYIDAGTINVLIADGYHTQAQIDGTGGTP